MFTFLIIVGIIYLLIMETTPFSGGASKSNKRKKETKKANNSSHSEISNGNVITDIPSSTRKQTNSKLNKSISGTILDSIKEDLDDGRVLEKFKPIPGISEKIKERNKKFSDISKEISDLSGYIESYYNLINVNAQEKLDKPFFVEFNNLNYELSSIDDYCIEDILEQYEVEPLYSQAKDGDVNSIYELANTYFEQDELLVAYILFKYILESDCISYKKDSFIKIKRLSERINDKDILLSINMNDSISEVITKLEGGIYHFLLSEQSYLNNVTFSEFDEIICDYDYDNDLDGVIYDCVEEYIDSGYIEEMISISDHSNKFLDYNYNRCK